MKRSIFTLVASVLLLGLSWVVPHSPFKVEVQIPTPTLVPSGGAVSIALPTPDSASAQGGIQVSYQNVSLVIPAGLASGADSEIGAAIEAPDGYYTASNAPAFTRVILKDYPVLSSDDFYKPEVRIYPAAEYTAMSLWAAETLKRLQNVLANPSSPLENDILPNVAFMGSAAQNYAAQVKILPFQNGNGVRMISHYAQYPAPISQNESFYHYEGLTQDGKYYVVVEMPLILPIYSDGNNPGENGITYPADRNNPAEMVAYYKSMTNLLNSAGQETFKPTLAQLDALVQSIIVTTK